MMTRFEWELKIAGREQAWGPGPEDFYSRSSRAASFRSLDGGQACARASPVSGRPSERTHVTRSACAVTRRTVKWRPAQEPLGPSAPAGWNPRKCTTRPRRLAAAPQPPPQPDLKKANEDKRNAFPPPDLDELNGQEISLDLQHLIEDQFRGEETMALFQEILPGARSPQQRSFPRTLAYMPQPVHSGASYVAPVPNNNHEQAPPIKEEPPEPHDFRRSVSCAQYTGQYNPQPPVGVSGPYGGGFTPLPPLGAPLLPPMLKHKPAPARRSSGKVLDKGTDEYRRRRERNNIAVRKSREKAKVRSREVEEKVKTLLREKEALLKRLEAVTGELSLHKQMYVHLINLNHPEITELCRSMLQLGAPHGNDHTL
ncbi:chorion specific C/EBP [Danaus plexippus plexippus]|uniref:Chorion specific C/EBP n=1 Tax=Danaus plexippus plexippus TaxID=278856 RepID=A0A212F933_DANPL|nr:chorion specific C/EBP [Danaus plexippus plexippus]